MTNLMRWLLYLGIFAIPYFSIIFRAVESDILDEWMFAIRISPIIILFLFGIYCVVILAYRVLTFNDCPKAAKELQQEIEEARRDLLSKGFKFRD